MSQKRPLVLFVGKKNNLYCEKAVEFMRLHFFEPTILLGQRGDVFPEDVGSWEGDYIISFLSPWILPEYLLNRASQASINFHTGSPEYPGIGCTNFAIYNQEKNYGITCHHMDSKVDTGKIIDVKRFPLYENDTVFSLTQRCYAYILTTFYEITSVILSGKELPESEESWKRKPFTRKELNELCVITKDMTEEEVSKRVKAVTFPNAPGAYIKINDMIFKYSEHRE